MSVTNFNIAGLIYLIRALQQLNLAARDCSQIGAKKAS